MDQQIKGQGGHLGFPIVQKNTDLVEDVELFNSIKFMLSSLREEVDDVSIYQRPGRSSWISDQPKNLTLVEDIEFLLPVKIRQIPFREVENVSADQRRGWVSILVFQ